MVIGGGVLLGLHDQLGQRGTFAVMAALTVITTIPVALAKEPPPPPNEDARIAGVHFLRRAGVWRLIALIVVYKAGESFAGGMLRPFLVDNGLDAKDVAKLVGTVGFIAGMAGALVGGAAVTKIGRRRSLVVFGIGQAITVAGYAYLAIAGAPTMTELYVWTGFEHFASGTATAALFTCMMDWSGRETSGTDYTVQASAVVIATGVAAALSGFSAQAFGYATHFVIAAVMCVIAILLAYVLFPKADA
jgi:predicted MFS family arabinose efflux permease